MSQKQHVRMVSPPLKVLTSQSSYLCITYIERRHQSKVGMNEESFTLDHSHKLTCELQVGCIIDKMAFLIHMIHSNMNNKIKHSLV